VAGIIINGLKESEAGLAEKTNPGLIAELSGVPVMGIIPFDDGVDVDTGKPGRIIELVEAGIDWKYFSEVVKL
jgi:dethiobiotin synthetase